MSNSGFFVRHGVTLFLGLFCAVMTWLLIQSEYLPESSALHDVPLEYLKGKFLHNENNSSLKILWKGEDIGGLAVQVFPRAGPSIRGTSLLQIPILGTRHKLRSDLNLKLNRKSEFVHLHLSGRYDDTRFEITTSTAQQKIQLKVQGSGIDLTREFPFASLQGSKREEIFNAVGPLPWSVPTETPDFKLHASNTRIYRLQDWMDAYLLDLRSDANTWFKIWMSPTGEILKADSSFGLRALNEDFFDETPSKGENPP